MTEKTFAKVGIGRGRTADVYTLQREQVLQRGSPVPGVTVQLLDEEDIEAYLAFQPDTAQMVTERLRQGDRCLAAWKGSRVVAARWLTTVRADIGPFGVSFPVVPGIAYAYDAFTAPDERRRGIGAMLSAALFELSDAARTTSIINAVLHDNPFGQGLARGRSKPLGVLRFNPLGPWLVVRCQIPPGYLGAPLPMEGQAPSAAGLHDPA